MKCLVFLCPQSILCQLIEYKDAVLNIFLTSDFLSVSMRLNVVADINIKFVNIHLITSYKSTTVRSILVQESKSKFRRVVAAFSFFFNYI